MPALFIRHTVTDYATWKRVFDELGVTCRAHGCQESRLFRNDDDQHEMLLLLTWDNLDRARLFAQSDDFREAMKRAGVSDEPDVWFLREEPG